MSRIVIVLIGLVAAVVTGLLPDVGLAGDADAGRRKAEPCVACHGAGGNSTMPTAPSLAGQPEFYVHWQLVLFRDQRRRDPQMSPFAEKLSDEDMSDLAAYYAAQKPTTKPAPPRDGQTMADGRRIAQFYHCASCHAPEIPGQRYAPNITGQSYEYLLKQLRGFKAQTRGELESAMTTAAQPLTADEIEILARYLAALPPATRP